MKVTQTSSVEIERRAHPLRGRSNMRAAVRLRLDGGVVVRGVVRQRVAPWLHPASRPRRLQLQTARAAEPRRLLGPHGRARWHIRELYNLRAHGNNLFSIENPT